MSSRACALCLCEQTKTWGNFYSDHSQTNKLIMSCNLRLHCASYVWSAFLWLKIQLLNIISTGGTLHLQHRINTAHYFQSLSVNTTVMQKSATSQKRHPPQFWLNLQDLEWAPTSLMRWHWNIHLTTLKQLIQGFLYKIIRFMQDTSIVLWFCAIHLPVARPAVPTKSGH